MHANLRRSVAVLRDRRARKASDLLQSNIFKEVQRAMQLNHSASISNIILPPRYGRKLPERVVELLLAWITYRRNIEILDVGHAHAMSCHLALLTSLQAGKRLIGIDINAPTYDPHLYYGESLIGDITRAPFLRDSFSLIWCISTLEHVGKDKSTSSYANQQGGTDIQALDELFRILATGGSLLITLPFGRYEDHGWLINYDDEHLQRLLEGVWSKATCTELYFRYTDKDGWVSTRAQELAFTGYYDQKNAGAAGLAAVHVEKK